MANFSYSQNLKGVADVFLRSSKHYKPLLEFFESLMAGVTLAKNSYAQILRQRAAWFLRQAKP